MDDLRITRRERARYYVIDPLFITALKKRHRRTKVRKNNMLNVHMEHVLQNGGKHISILLISMALDLICSKFLASSKNKKH